MDKVIISHLRQIPPSVFCVPNPSAFSNTSGNKWISYIWTATIYPSLLAFSPQHLNINKSLPSWKEWTPPSTSGFLHSLYCLLPFRSPRERSKRLIYSQTPWKSNSFFTTFSIFNPLHFGFKLTIKIIILVSIPAGSRIHLKWFKRRGNLQWCRQ